MTRVSCLVAILAASLAVASPAAASPSLSATKFVDSVGVNVHMNYTGMVDRDHVHVLRLLQRIGVKHVRDGHHGGRTDTFPKWNLLADNGVKLTLIEDWQRDAKPGADGSIASRLAEIQSGKIRGVEALEGPNEPNTRWPFVDYPGAGTAPFAVKTADTMRTLLAERDARLPGLAVYGPSLTNWQAYAHMKDQGLATLEDVSSLHPYPGGQVPNGALAWAISNETNRVHPGGFPFAVTETGYHTAVNQTTGHVGVSEDVAAAYVPWLLLDSYWRGARRTFIYQLADAWNDPQDDEAEANFGLARWKSPSTNEDFRLKPAGAAVRVLTHVMSAPGTQDVSGDLAYTLSAPGVSKLLLRRGDGRYVLAVFSNASLWNTSTRRSIAPVDKRVTVGLPSTMDVDAYTTRRGTDPYRTCRGSSVDVKVPGLEMVLLVIGPPRDGAPPVC